MPKVWLVGRAWDLWERSDPKTRAELEDWLRLLQSGAGQKYPSGSDKGATVFVAEAGSKIIRIEYYETDQSNYNVFYIGAGYKL